MLRSMNSIDTSADESFALPSRREEYLRRMADEPRAQSHIIASHDADGVVVTRHQSATDRFGGRGFVSEPCWVGGSSTQENGGTCSQDAYVEKGKRSAGSVTTQRIIAATSKSAGKRRKGISKKTIQRISYLGRHRQDARGDRRRGQRERQPGQGRDTLAALRQPATEGTSRRPCLRQVRLDLAS
jgi:hypothetical protein